MFAMFRLGRPNVLPVGDLGVRRGMENLYRLKVCIQIEPFSMHHGNRPFKQKLYGAMVCTQKLNCILALLPSSHTTHCLPSMNVLHSRLQTVSLYSASNCIYLRSYSSHWACASPMLLGMRNAASGAIEVLL